MFVSCISFSRYFWNFSVCGKPTNVCACICTSLHFPALFALITYQSGVALKMLSLHHLATAVSPSPKQTHTHTKHKDDFPTHKKWEGRDLITECTLCLPFFLDLPQCKAESFLDCTSNQSMFLMYLFSWLMAQTAGTQTLKALSVRDLDLTFHVRPNVQVCVLSHTALHQ